MILKRPNILVWCSLALAWLFDLLFWDKVPGISFPIYVVFIIAVGIYLSRTQELKPAPGALLLLLPITFFSIMTFTRTEPMSVFLNYTSTLLLLGLFTHTFLGGRWPFYTIKEYLTGAFLLGINAISRQAAVFHETGKAASKEGTDEKPSFWKRSMPVLRGLLLALPVVLFFTALLSSADPIFEQGVDDFFALFKIENLAEYIFRSILILIIAYLLAGIYIHAFYKDHDEALDPDKPFLPRFLGITESAIILGSVNLLFAAFVVIQFQYFFGGEANVAAHGYTYSEYARRGFSELVTVAVFSLLMYLGLSAITKRENKNSQPLFSGLGITLVLLVGVMLVSALQRLLLYENAYGFTRLRTYTHVFIFWLAGLLAVTILLELLGKQRFFTLAAVLAGFGFVSSLDFLNIDAFIVKQNVARGLTSTIDGQDTGRSDSDTLDISYIASLSVDAVPTLASLYHQALENGEYTEAIAGALTCHAYIHDSYDYSNDPSRNYTWQSFHTSRYLAARTWQQLMGGPNAGDFVILVDEGDEWDQNPRVIINGEEVSCYSSNYYWSD